jgi:uncharacterized protein (DUF2141 family)
MIQLILVVTLFVSGLSSESNAELEVQIELTRTDPEGMVRIALCQGRHAYEKVDGCHTQSATADNQVVKLIFTGLRPGEYAIKALHDVNGNGDMDYNMLGLPKEPYGFSNNVMGAFGPPDFDDAKVILKPGRNLARFKMRE